MEGDNNRGGEDNELPRDHDSPALTDNYSNERERRDSRSRETGERRDKATRNHRETEGKDNQKSRETCLSQH